MGLFTHLDCRGRATRSLGIPRFDSCQVIRRLRSLTGPGTRHRLPFAVPRGGRSVRTTDDEGATRDAPSGRPPRNRPRAGQARDSRLGRGRDADSPARPLPASVNTDAASPSLTGLHSLRTLPSVDHNHRFQVVRFSGAGQDGTEDSGRRIEPVKLQVVRLPRREGPRHGPGEDDQRGGGGASTAEVSLIGRHDPILWSVG
jgi:hypothetical protein